jgi:hypothetical protein
MKNDTPELTDTTINIKIRTGVMHRNKADEARTRIDYTGFYVSAINYFIRVALEAQSHLEMGTNSVVLNNDAKFRENLQFLIQIQEAFTEWLPDYASELNRDSKPCDQNALDLSEQLEDCQELEKLAVQISKVMKNPLIPTRLYNAMSDELTAVIADSDSPEWILGNLKKLC